MATITQFGAFIEKAHFPRDLVDKLTYSWEDYKGREDKQTVISRGEKYIKVPRFAAFCSGLDVKVSLHPGKKIENVRLRGALKDNQIRIIESIMGGEFAAPKRGNAGAILKLGTGFGKTYIAMGLIERIRRKTLIVVHRISLAEQWRKCIAGFLECSVSLWREQQDTDIVIEVINTLEKVKDYSLYREFGFVIFDEVHKFCTMGKYERVLSKCQSYYMLGMSATPERNDGSELIAIACLGPIKTFELVSDVVFDVEIVKVGFRGAKEHTKTVYRDVYGNLEVDYSTTLENILSEDARAERIIDELEKVDDGRYIYVFSDRRNYLTKLSKMLVARYAARGEEADDIYFIIGGMKDFELLKTKQNARIIFATYQCASEGESIDRMNTLILATPCKNQIEQTMGRILRSNSDGKKRILIDIVDEDTLLYKQWRVRKDFYLSRNYKIK